MVEIPEDVKIVQAETVELQTQIKQLQVVDQESFDRANSLLKETKAKIKIFEDKLDPIKKKAYAAYKDVLDLIKELTDPLIKIQNILKGKIGPYLQEQERKRQEAIEKARKEAEEKRLKDAEVLEEQGLTEEAEKLIDKRTRINTSEVAPKIDKGGTYTVTKWHAEVTDKAALIEAVATGRTDSEVLIPNMPHLNRLATIHKENMKIPGVKAVSEVSVGVRG